MISLINVNRARLGPDGETVVEEYRGLSGDTKPTLLRNRNGSVFYEMDTRKVYMYDGENQIWLPQ
jgi:hypothetical protein